MNKRRERDDIIYEMPLSLLDYLVPSLIDFLLHVILIFLYTYILIFLAKELIFFLKIRQKCYGVRV